MADFFADTLSQMSQNFSDLFFNVLTGKFDDLKDLAKQAFEAILRSFLDLVSAIATRQIVLSIGGLFGLKGEQQGGGNPVQAGQKAIGAGTNIAGLFGSGGAFATLGAGLGLSSSAAFTTAAGGGAALLGTGSFAAGGSVGASLAETAATPGLLATAGAAITIIGAALAAAALVVTLILPLLKKTPHFAFKFESIKTDIGERAALVKEFLDPELFSDEIFKTLSSHGGGGAFSGKERDKLKDAIQKAIADTIQSIQDIINKLPADMAAILNDALLNTAVDMESKIGRSNLLGFDAKGAKNIQDKLEKFLQGDLQGRFLESIRSFFQEAFVALGALPEKAQAVIDEQFAAFQKAGSPEARAEIGKALLDQFNAFVDAFNIVSGNVNDAIGQTIQGEEFESRLAA